MDEFSFLTLILIPMKQEKNESHFTINQVQSTALTCAFIGIFPTHSHDTPFTMASCGTTVAGMRHFSTLVQFPVPVG